MNKIAMISSKPTPQDLVVAQTAMSFSIRFYPSDDKARELILRELQSMVPTVEALNWLVEAYVRRIGEWVSLKELRAVLCTYCVPADGVRAISSIEGFRPQDIEPEYAVPTAEETATLLAGYRQLEAGNDPAIEAQLQVENAKIQSKISHLADDRKLKRSRSRVAPAWLDNLGV